MPLKALVVDNDFFFVEFLSELLEAKGYQVSKAYDGKEGISLLEADSYDLVFVDLVMPKIDGRRFIEYVRKAFPDARFPVVAVSGTMVEQIEDIPGIGADLYVAKGPMEKMSEDLNVLIDRLGTGERQTDRQDNLLDPGNLIPGLVTMELIDSLNFQKAVIESAGIGILVLDRDSRILKFNPLAMEIVGLPFERILNRPVTTVFSPSAKPGLIQALISCAREAARKRITLAALSESAAIRATVSLLRLENKPAGWILALEV